MKSAFPVYKWKNFNTTLPEHVNNVIGLGFKGLSIFIDLADFPKAGLNHNSPSLAWFLYMNHCFTFFGDPMRSWTFDGRTHAFDVGPKNEDMKSAFIFCKKYNITPFVNFGHSEEKNSWLTRSPSMDKWLWLRRFSLEFARYLKYKYKFIDVPMEVWNEPSECMSVYTYVNVSVNMEIGWHSIYPNSNVYVGESDISNTSFLNGILTDAPLMSRKKVVLSAHILKKQEWESNLIDEFYNKSKAIGKYFALTEINPLDNFGYMEKMLVKDKNGNTVGAKVIMFAPVLFIRNDIVGNANEFRECLIFYKDRPREWQVVHSDHMKETKEFNKRVWS
ncbi:hypothetical protein LLG07_02470 [bacterium]|nr:hypothetical protein [bacterium]